MKPKLEQIVKELNKRKTEPFKLENYLFDKQLEFVQHPARFKVAVNTRRSGKTVSCAADLIYTAINNIEVTCLYITLSRSNAKRIVWPELKRICRKFALEAEFNESELCVKFNNGSIIYCSGASDKTEIEKFRGLAIKKAYIDESQSFPAYIEELIDDVIAPALMDYAGTLCLIGTPGPIPTGYFYDSSRSPSWQHFFWSFWDNPHIQSKSGLSHQEIFEAELKRRGVSAEDPSVQREWYGKWLLDTDSLVYRYNNGVNHYEKLPEAKWNYILGVDLGFNDADAICVLAWSESSPNTFLVEEKITRHQGITELVGQINDLRTKYDITKVVVDTGGLGKKIAEELARRYLIHVVPAEKIRKVEYIELMNDCLRTGKLMAKSNSHFASDCMKVEWDHDKSTPDKKVISKRYHSDICEAVLYAWRECYGYSYQKPLPNIVMGSKAYLDELEEKAREHFEALEKSNNDGEFNPF